MLLKLKPKYLYVLRGRVKFPQSHVCRPVCSLRNNMFELADRLVGIYKTDNCTKSITINPGSFAESMKVV